jgi:hypothetical protein
MDAAKVVLCTGQSKPGQLINSAVTAETLDQDLRTLLCGLLHRFMSMEVIT